MKIKKVIENNIKNSSNKQSSEDTEAQANRLKLTHNRVMDELEMKKIDLNFNLRKHLASTNVHGDIDMWSRQLIDIKKNIKENQEEIDIATEIKKEFFTQSEIVVDKGH